MMSQASPLHCYLPRLKTRVELLHKRLRSQQSLLRQRKYGLFADTCEHTHELVAQIVSYYRVCRTWYHSWYNSGPKKEPTIHHQWNRIQLLLDEVGNAQHHTRTLVLQELQSIRASINAPLLPPTQPKLSTSTPIMINEEV